jgi:hypothetical protein
MALDCNWMLKIWLQPMFVFLLKNSSINNKKPPTATLLRLLARSNALANNEPRHLLISAKRQLSFEKTADNAQSIIQGKQIMQCLKHWRYMVLSALCMQFSAVQATCTLEQLTWLSGEWQASMGKSTVLERWQVLSADTFEGDGQTIAADGKVKQQESLRLMQMQQQIFYLAKVAHNPLPVAFKLEECTAGRLKFVNMAHDFPKQLEYILKQSAPEQTAKRATENQQLQVHVSDAAGKGFTLLFSKKQ